MSGQAWATLGVALYGAALSSFLAWRQVWQERRRLRILARTLVWVQGEGTFLEVLEVRALNEGRRPVYVFQAGVITADGSFIPRNLISRDGAVGAGTRRPS